MADDEEEKGNEEAAEGGGKSKVLILVVLGLLLVGISVGGTIAALKFLGGDETVAAQEGENQEPEETPIPKAIYYPIKPPILVSFESRGRQRMLQAEVTLMTRENDVISAVETHMPMVRNALVMLIGGQVYEEIQTAEGKELMRVQCLQELQNIMQQEIDKPGIEQVLFTSLILQ